jgi:hypothetical protein
MWKNGLLRLKFFGLYLDKFTSHSSFNLFFVISELVSRNNLSHLVNGNGSELASDFHPICSTFNIWLQFSVQFNA